jgi:CHAD domain-containing protein
MEIEAKFSVPGLETFQHLRDADQIAGFSLAAGQTKVVHDTYVDSPGKSILAAGYACRFRQEPGGVRITLKGLGGARGAIHEREELEVLLPVVQSPDEWPAGPLRDRVLALIDDRPLLRLFELHQTRIVRPVEQQGRRIAELSLDDVEAVVAGSEQSYFELEIELAPHGDKDDLTAIAAALQKDWGLVPQPRSKFERALGLLESRGDDRLLTVQERAICSRIAQQDGWHARRASALLALDDGVSPLEVSRRVERSTRTLRRWLAAFRNQRLDLFPAAVLREALPLDPFIDLEGSLQGRPGALEPTARRPDLKAEPPDKPGLEADDTIDEAARKTLHFHFQRMLYHERGTRLGEDIEELHDMRVATRRMRAALQVFGDYLDAGRMASFFKGLQRTGRALGAVRDLDVFWEKTGHYLDTLPPERQHDLDPLRAAWEAERERARERMLVHLDSDRYRRFTERFGAFLQTPGAGALPPFSEEGEPLPRRLRHVAPVLIYQRMAAVGAYDEWVTGPDVPLERLHRLRIASKGLRYTLEFLEEVLGPEAKTPVKEIKRLQDHLGDLQDAVVASGLLRDFLTWGTWGHDRAQGAAKLPSEPVVAPGVAAYLAARQVELQHLLETFPATWAQVHSSNFCELVAAALGALQLVPIRE